MGRKPKYQCGDKVVHITNPRVTWMVSYYDKQDGTTELVYFCRTVTDDGQLHSEYFQEYEIEFHPSEEIK